MARVGVECRPTQATSGCGGQGVDLEETSGRGAGGIQAESAVIVGLAATEEDIRVDSLAGCHPRGAGAPDQVTAGIFAIGVASGSRTRPDTVMRLATWIAGLRRWASLSSTCDWAVPQFAVGGRWGWSWVDQT